MTKILVAIAATAILSTSAMAQDLGSNLALNTELKAFHKVDAETKELILEYCSGFIRFGIESFYRCLGNELESIGQ